MNMYIVSMVHGPNFRFEGGRPFASVSKWDLYEEGQTDHVHLEVIDRSQAHL